MNSPLFLALPLIAGLLFAVAAIFTKRAIDSGLGPWRMTFINNTIFLVVFAPLLWLDGVPWHEVVWYQPLALSVAVSVGMLLMFFAFSQGAVSVAAPIMGTKVIFVALFTVGVLGEPVPMAWWLAAVLATLGIGCLRIPTPTDRRRSRTLTIGYAVASAACFALTDVLVQRWVTPASFTRVLPVSYALAALSSLALVGLFRESLAAIPRRVWGYLLPGGVLMAVQGMLLVFALSRFGHATVLNVLYNTRGLWSVLIIWVVGHWFASEEAAAGHRVMAARLVGAALLLAAVVLVLR